MFRPSTIRLFALAGAVAAIVTAADNVGSETAALAVQGGTATFAVNTNVPAISVKGRTGALEARVLLRRGAGPLQLDKLEARVPVKTLATGMGLRDEHMRKYIFTTGQGQTPDLVFSAEAVTCAGAGPDTTCPVSGTLTIRGVGRPFTLALKVHQDGAAFKASGEGAVKLSAFGIEQPSQFGVRTSDEVLLHLEFVARPAADASTAEVRR
jgi:polyisoprenoid-binding protein YceI